MGKAEGLLETQRAYAAFFEHSNVNLLNTLEAYGMTARSIIAQADETFHPSTLDPVIVCQLLCTGLDNVQSSLD